MKKLLIIIVGTALAGCASFSTTAFRLEKVAADTGTAGVHSFNLYYNATSNSNPTALDDLNKKRDAVYDASRKLSASLSVLEAARAQYDLNSADTNKVSLQLALEAVSSQSSNIVWLVKYFMGPSK